MRIVLIGSGGWIRTSDQLINSQLRYHCATPEWSSGEYYIKFSAPGARGYFDFRGSRVQLPCPPKYADGNWLEAEEIEGYQRAAERQLDQDTGEKAQKGSKSAPQSFARRLAGKQLARDRA